MQLAKREQIKTAVYVSSSNRILDIFNIPASIWSQLLPEYCQNNRLGPEERNDFPTLMKISGLD